MIPMPKVTPIATHAPVSIAARLNVGACGVPVEHEDVEQQQRDDEPDRCEPCPGGHVDVDELCADGAARDHFRNYFVSDLPPSPDRVMMACAAARRAIGTRNGLQLT